MTDLAIIQGTERGAPPFDIGVAGGDLSLDDSLRASVIVSLFSDGRARAASDDIPDGDDPRGWWGEELEPEGGPWGSRLWLLARAKTVPETLRRAEDYAREALDWMLRERVAERIQVAASELPPRLAARGAILRLDVTIHRPSAPPVNMLFDRLWEAL